MEKLELEHYHREQDMNNQERVKLNLEVQHLESELKRLEGELGRGVTSESQAAQFKEHIADIEHRINEHNDAILRLNAEDEDLKRKIHL